MDACVAAVCPVRLHSVLISGASQVGGTLAIRRKLKRRMRTRRPRNYLVRSYDRTEGAEVDSAPAGGLTAWHATR